ncbi:hypothetical protein, variant [Aphanomyces astaci]|uniref:START domain-containing protein n=1 Tax=Aphanomyces astaci TaxID=112090 RepID=W4GBY3_APHAT|nr:hypothetical protein, variant [Aphanomyces astaci]ETV77192.1 hypothetical protein, variant [Aphanomyces astaci]|eukprot:XP_009833498.1 hypothetical protein, variant [Aphanomyces astaci]
MASSPSCVLPPRKSSILQPTSSFHMSCNGVSFPLLALAFDTPALSSEQVASLLATSNKSFDALYQRCLGPTRLTARSTKVHVMAVPAAAPPGVWVSTSVNICATLDEVRALHNNSTQSTVHFSDDILDSKVLYTVEDSPEQVVLVRWQALQYGLPVHHRDVVLLETHRDFDWPDGRRAYGYAQDSISLPCCEDLYDAFQLVRGSMRNSGLVFVESDNVEGQLEVHFHCEMDLKGSIPSWLATRLLRQSAVLHLTCLTTRLHETRLTKRVKCQYVVLVDKVFCWACTQFWRLEAQSTRVCVDCANDYSSDPAHPQLLDSSVQGYFPILRHRASTTAGLNPLRKLKSVSSFDDKRSTENESDDIEWTATMTSNLAVLGDDWREKSVSTRPSRSKSAFYVW